MNWSFAFVERRGVFAEFLRFGVIGAGSGILYAVVLVSCISGLEMEPAFGAALATCPAVIVNYLGHYHWSFRSKRGHLGSSIRYLTVYLLFFIINTAGMAVLAALSSLHYGVAQLVVVAAVSVSYPIQRRWVFGGSRGDGRQIGAIDE